MTMMTSAQFQLALKFARAYGHEWANHQEVRYLLKSKTLAPTTELIEAIIAAKEGLSGEDIIGIRCPKMEGGSVTHTTLTERLRWDIYPDGEVKILISRPAGWVLEVFIKPDPTVLKPVLEKSIAGYPDWVAGSVRMRPRRDVCSSGEGLHDRHIDAAEEAVSVLVGKTGAQLAFSELRKSIQPETLLGGSQGSIESC
jgi:hypothetical protein